MATTITTTNLKSTTTTTTTSTITTISLVKVVRLLRSMLLLLVLLLRPSVDVVAVVQLLLGFGVVVSAAADEANGGGDYDDDGEIDFPPLLDSDDIRYYASQYDLDGLHWALSNVFKRSARNPRFDEIKYPQQLPQALVSKGGGSFYTSKYKLQMDLEQAQYLVENLLGNGDNNDNDNDDNDDDQKTNLIKVAYYLRDVVIPTYENVLKRIPPLDDLKRTNGLYAFRTQDIEDDKILDVYNKAFHHTDFDLLKDSVTGNVLPLLNHNFDSNKIESKWFGRDDHDHDDDNLSRPGVVVIDDILSPDALQRIHQLLLESQVFYQTKMPLKFGGYAGAYIDDGLHDKILLQLAFELSKALPNIIGRSNPLKYLWAYKYDSEHKGISIHADQAAVNVNIWLTPTEASLDLDHGGLVVYTAKPPIGANFEAYNTNVELAIEEILKPTGFANVTVPYRQNRAVIFDSALFHQTDTFTFRKGYTNRRINLTMLYGEMQQGQKQQQQHQHQHQTPHQRQEEDQHQKPTHDQTINNEL